MSSTAEAAPDRIRTLAVRGVSVRLSERPGIGFEAQSALYQVMRDLVEN